MNPMEEKGANEASAEMRVKQSSVDDSTPS